MAQASRGLLEVRLQLQTWPAPGLPAGGLGLRSPSRAAALIGSRSVPRGCTARALGRGAPCSICPRVTFPVRWWSWWFLTICPPECAQLWGRAGAAGSGSAGSARPTSGACLSHWPPSGSWETLFSPGVLSPSARWDSRHRPQRVTAETERGTHARVLARCGHSHDKVEDNSSHWVPRASLKLKWKTQRS